ncbi:hypothetical protein ACFFV7_16055 [Nonomuraea spiralis]|uniref:Uncharacterized protein n=1 Tax=Nonomuraea spiralis TaxID=46182 RepID=A0ABV5IE34_9ACTN|nr:hypothetical protein [Nonomuraea spiralis]
MRWNGRTGPRPRRRHDPARRIHWRSVGSAGLGAGSSSVLAQRVLADLEARLTEPAAG